jgi:hypothetical protein
MSLYLYYIINAVALSRRNPYISIKMELNDKILIVIWISSRRGIVSWHGPCYMLVATGGRVPLARHKTRVNGVTMMRRNYSYNGKRNHSGSWWPQPPMKTVYHRSNKPHQVPTEVHRAFSSFGQDNRTGRLSDGEFYSQVGAEIGYMASKSRAHAGNAVRALCDLLDALFED